ncbi:PA2817 family protein [Thalassolituus sp. LLYu03]|uniref:PA2817 family protein n=1 Tax=Thalassolituus sp. LLYu03 TaxID=3421656 RepID=UPI003D2D8905
MSERLNHHIALLEQVAGRLTRARSDAADLISEEILQQLERVIDQLKEHSDAGYELGIAWLSQLFTHHPQLAPAVDRDLLWFFGGECLHYLSDEEITLFQQLDELEEDANANGQSFDRALTRRTLSAQGGYNA